MLRAVSWIIAIALLVGFAAYYIYDKNSEELQADRLAGLSEDLRVLKEDAELWTTPVPGSWMYYTDDGTGWAFIPDSRGSRLARENCDPKVYTLLDLQLAVYQENPGLLAGIKPVRYWCPLSRYPRLLDLTAVSHSEESPKTAVDQFISSEGRIWISEQTPWRLVITAETPAVGSRKSKKVSVVVEYPEVLEYLRKYERPVR